MDFICFGGGQMKKAKMLEESVNCWSLELYQKDPLGQREASRTCSAWQTLAAKKQKNNCCPDFPWIFHGLWPKRAESMYKRLVPTFRSSGTWNSTDNCLADYPMLNPHQLSTPPPVSAIRPSIPATPRPAPVTVKQKGGGSPPSGGRRPT